MKLIHTIIIIILEDFGEDSFMIVSLEKNFVDSYIIKARRERTLFCLKTNRRAEYVDKLTRRDFMANKMHPIKRGTPEELINTIKSYVGCEKCYIIYPDTKYDGKLYDSFDNFIWNYFGCGPFVILFIETLIAYFEEEYTSGPPGAYMLYDELLMRRRS